MSETSFNLSLKNFYVFNSTFGTTEGEEHKKILYFHPGDSELDSQIREVGLCEAIIKFTRTFTSDENVHSLRTQKTIQLFYQPELEFWMIMTINLPYEKKVHDDTEYNDYKGDDTYEMVYKQVLKQSYMSFRIFENTFISNLIGVHDEAKRDCLKSKLSAFYDKYLNEMRVEDSNLLNIVRGMQYYPLNKLQFLRVHNFVQNIESSFSSIEHTVVLSKNKLIWSGVNPNDLYTVHEYLINHLMAIKSDSESSAESFQCDSLYGAYLTGPEANSCVAAPLIHIFNNEQCHRYRLIVYTAHSLTICLFVHHETSLNDEFYDEIHRFIGPLLATIASEITDETKNTNNTNKSLLCTINVLRNTNETDENIDRFLYINELNCQYSGNLDIESANQSKKIPISVMNLLTDLYTKDAGNSSSREMIVKTLNDFWIIKRTNNWRHSFVIFNKSSTMLEIADEANKFFEQFVNDN